MTVGDLRKMLEVLPDSFAVRIDCKSDVQEHIRNVSIEHGAIVLRQHMLTVNKVVETVTAFDGVEYILEVKTVKYPTVVQMPNPVHSQLRKSVLG
jgi:hypothetical protein